MKKVLLIGGEGFIGNRFNELTSKDILVDDYYDCMTWDLKNDQNINLDVPRETINRVGYQPSVFDTVIYLAAKPNLASVIKHPKDAWKTGTNGLYKAINQYKDSHFIFISSSMVYGNWTKTSMSEEDNCSPNNIYGQLKLLGEGLVKQFHNNYTIVRPSAVYGHRDNKSRITQLFINKIINNQTITLNGAENLFDFTYVDDVVQGLYSICEKGADNKTYNITRSQAHTLRNFTEMLYDKLGKKPNFIVKSVPENYPIRGTLNINKAKKELGYNPQFSLSQGLDEVLNKL